ncbi:NAD(P)-binding protein [Peniophora sp. CONT]|nr:NAD(P)-binding protein [Peniophora sp. CONT]
MPDLVASWFSRHCDYDPSRDIPDQTGKVFMITGGCSGIGYECTKQLLSHGATVYMAGRSPCEAATAIEQLEDDLPHIYGRGRVRYLKVDMSNMHDVQRAAESFMARVSRLDVLIHNEGRALDCYEMSKEGVELSLAVNHLGISVLTETLMPVLKETASRSDSDVRVVVVSSRAHTYRPRKCTLSSLEEWNQYGGVRGDSASARQARFGMTRYMNLLWVQQLQKVLDAEDVPITALALHPTDGLADQLPNWLNNSVKSAGFSLDKASYTTLFAATSPKVKSQHDAYKGKYLEPFGRPTQPRVKDAGDAENAEVLWRATEESMAAILSKPSEGWQML